MNMRHWLIASTLLLTASAASADQYRESYSSVEEAQAAMAQTFTKVLRDLGVKKLQIKAFSNIGFPGQNLDIPKSVAEQLAKSGIHKANTAQTTITGEIRRTPFDQSKGLKGLEIRASLTTQDGKTQEFIFAVPNNSADAVENGIEGSGEFNSPAQTEYRSPERNPEVRGTSVEIPRGAGNFVTTMVDAAYPSPKSPYQVAVQVRNGDTEGYLPRKLSLNRAHGETAISTFGVDLSDGDEYEILLTNDTEYFHAAEVKIDGVSRFALAKNESLRSCVDIIPPKTTRVIKGYFRDLEKADAFLVGRFEDSVVAKLMPEAPSAGTIVVTFMAAWKPGESEPPHEESGLVSATQAGRERSDPIKIENFQIGSPRAVISIEYGDD